MRISIARWWIPTCAAALMAACGGSDTSSGASVTGQACSGTACGSAVLTLTDAAGDFLSYTVDLTSLQLKKANGALVETLPATTRIDFAQLVDLSEVISTGQIPNGDYVGATITVDYTNANILVDDGTGGSVQVSPLDTSGNAVGKMTLAVQLDNKHHLVISHGKASRVAFDFNLLASNTVDLTAHSVTVTPLLVASVIPTDTKEIRVRGALESVDTTAGAYTVQVRPFHEHETSHSTEMTVQTDGNTAFEIDGAVFSGAAGLAQLASLTNNPLTIAFGTLSNTDQTFTARRVLAGTSVEHPNKDHLIGNVIARDGNTLTVRGGEMEHHDEGEVEFEHGDVIVTLGDNTLVTREGQTSGTHTIADLSVGQRIEVYGTTSTNGSSEVEVDATAGQVRMDFTSVFGTVISKATGEVSLDLDAIDGRRTDAFDFTGTGSDPTHYLVDTGALDTSGLGANESARILGFVTPFGAAPPDFTATTLVDFKAASAVIKFEWEPGGSASPFDVVDATGLTLNVGGGLLSEESELKVDEQEIDLAHLSGTVQIVPSTAATAVFSIGHRDSNAVDNFASFADFIAALTADMSGSNRVVKLTAEGSYDRDTQTFTAEHLLVILSN